MLRDQAFSFCCRVEIEKMQDHDGPTEARGVDLQQWQADTSSKGRDRNVETDSAHVQRSFADPFFLRTDGNADETASVPFERVLTL